MTSLLGVLRLEVDTTPNRSALRNPSGRLGKFGWGSNTSITAISNSTSPIAEDGYAFSLPDLSSVNAMWSAPVPAASGTNRVKFDWRGVFSTARQVTFAAVPFNAAGDALTAAIVFHTYTFAANTPRFINDISLQSPAGAVMYRFLIQVAAGAGSGLLAGMYATSNTPGDTTPRPTTPTTWTNILSKAYSIVTDQGNTLDGVQDVLTAGSLVAGISDAALDPATTATLQKGRPVRLTATVAGVTKSVWAGVIETADVDYDDTKGAASAVRINLTATDDARKLLDSPIAFARVGGYYDQIGDACQSAGLSAYDAAFDLSPASSLTKVAVTARDDSAKASDWMRRANNTHGGYTWVDGANRVQCRLISYLPTAPVAVMSDTHADVGSLKYTSIGLNFGTRNLINGLGVKRINVDEIEDNGAKEYGPYLVPASESVYGRVSDTIEITGGSPSAVAASVLPVFATPKVFPKDISFAAHNDLAGVLAVGLYDAVRVKRTSPAFDQVVRVLRIRHEIRARVGGDTWKTTVTPRPLESATPANVIVPSAGADTGPGDIAAPLPGIIARRERHTTFSMANGQNLTVPFDTAGADSYGIAWDASNNRFVIPKDGRYHLSTAIRWATNGNGWRSAYIAVNGVGILPDLNSGGQFIVSKVSGSLYLRTGDVVSVLVFQNSGGALNIEGDQFFTIAYMGA
jgi:hypothetical protein